MIDSIEVIGHNASCKAVYGIVRPLDQLGFVLEFDDLHYRSENLKRNGKENIGDNLNYVLVIISGHEEYNASEITTL